MTQYRRIISLDLDILLLQPIDHLLAPSCGLDHFDVLYSAGPGSPWNGGFFVVQPSTAVYERMRARLRTANYSASGGAGGACAYPSRGSVGSACLRGGYDELPQLDLATGRADVRRGGASRGDSVWHQLGTEGNCGSLELPLVPGAAGIVAGTRTGGPTACAVLLLPGFCLFLL